MRAWTLVLGLVAACGDNFEGNRDPIVGELTLSTDEDLPVSKTIDVVDLDNDELIATVPIPPEHGEVTISGLVLTYTPAPNYHGNDQFALTIGDGAADVSITVDVSVRTIPDPPIGGPDSLATNEDTPRIVPVELLLANDSDADGDTITVKEVGSATNGTVSLANGMVTFAPDANFVGGGSFTYTITDGVIDTPVEVEVVVAGANDIPVANDDSVTTTEDTAITIQGTTLLANDTDADGQTLTISAVGTAVGGTVALNGGNPIFTPNLNATAGSFIYTVTDGIATDTALVTVVITAANDGPDAVNDTATTTEDTAVVVPVLANDTDPDSTPTILGTSNASGGTPAINGNGTITFTPNLNFNGTASFDYTITDGTLQDTATVTITVTAVNDVVVAVDDSGTTDEATPITFSTLTANDTDPDIATNGQTLTVIAVTNAVNGTVALNGGSPIFTPTTNSPTNATGTFEYTVSDGNGSTDTGTVTVTITPINNGPNAVNDTATTDEDDAVTISVLANDTDPDSTPTISGTTNAVNGAAVINGDGTITFTPAPNFNGTASFDYTITDGTEQDTATVTITVDPVNDPVTAVDDSGTTLETAAITFTNLTANDTDVDIATNGQTLTVTAVGSATNGTVVLNGGQPIFTPTTNSNTVETGTFQYTVSDGNGSTDTGTVTISITPVGDPPDAVNDTATTDEDTAVIINVLANDTDPDSTPTVLSVANAQNGTPVINGNGTITFTPAANFNGTASFDYTITDTASTDTASVTITVNAVNDDPVAVADIATTDEKTPITINVIANDTDVDIATNGQTLTLFGAGPATNGTVVANSSTSLTFTPTTNSSTNQIGIVSYIVSDGNGGTATGTVTITITPVNDPPTAVADAVTQIDSAVAFPHATFLGNDNDGGDGGTLTITGVGGATNGTVTLEATTVTFTPTAVGPASFTYTISDGGAVTSTATVTVTVVDCGDGTVTSPTEGCDDGNNTAGDGCSATCKVETGFECAGAPSVCTPICGDGEIVGSEECDDQNSDETDGCTSECVVGVICNSADFGGAPVAVDPATGNCFVKFTTGGRSFGAAQNDCVNAGGHLATITSSDENGVVSELSGALAWLGGTEDANLTDEIFDWVTGEAFTFADFALNHPDINVAGCLAETSGGWIELGCGNQLPEQICEIEVEPCGDGALQPDEECDGGPNCNATCGIIDGCGDGNLDPGEECDDDNLVSGDNCSSTCQVEDGCGDGNLDAGEECDDDNTTSGDGCSSTCTSEPLTQFNFTGSVATPSLVATGLSVSAMTGAIGTPTFVGGANPAFSLNTWTNAGQFFEFTLTPDPGRAVSLTGLAFDSQRSNTGPAEWFAFVVVGSDEVPIGTGAHPLALGQSSVTISGAASGPYSAPVKIRIRGTVTTNAAGTARLDNVEVNGSLSP